MKALLRPALARPALHVLLTLGFAAAFFWPILALTQPSQVFHFSYAAWGLSLCALLSISRIGGDPESSGGSIDAAVSGAAAGEEVV